MEDTVLFHVDGLVGYITLNRPNRLNAINDVLPALLEKTVEQANKDSRVRVIVLQGAGKGFCSGYDLALFAQKAGKNPGWQESDKGLWDPLLDYAMMRRNTDHFMSLFRSPKPVIVKTHGAGAVAGGSGKSFVLGDPIFH